MTANPLIDQYASQIRQRNAAKAPTVRAGVAKLARRVAADIHKDLPDLDREQLGAVLLRVAGFAHNLQLSNPDSTARDVAGLLDAAGEWMYHHADAADEPGCEG